MKQTTKHRFAQKYRRRVGRRRIEDRHYYHGGEDHEQLVETIREYDVWTAVMYGKHASKAHRELPRLFKRFPATWEQLFFIRDSEAVTVYRGNSLGSGYRFTHGIMANAFALLSREREIETFVLSEGPRGGLRIHVSDTLLVHGHELCGNYPLSRDAVDSNVPESMRIYGPIQP